MRAKRSHGFAREMSGPRFEEAKNKYPDVHPQFLFITDGYNFRNTEINAVLGISQLKNLDKNNRQRLYNFNKFVSLISKYDELSVDVDTRGISPYCMIFKCDTEELRRRLERYLQDNGVETRPLCSGNLLNQPFLQEYELDIPWLSNVQRLDTNGFFIGNNHLITEEEFELLGQLLDEFFTE